MGNKKLPKKYIIEEEKRDWRWALWLFLGVFLMTIGIYFSITLKALLENTQIDNLHVQIVLGFFVVFSLIMSAGGLMISLAGGVMISENEKKVKEKEIKIKEGKENAKE